MGYMSTGALSVGQGRKPKSSHEKWLGGNAGKRGGGKRRAADTLPIPEPPASMTSQQKEAWNELAPAACKMRTLTDEMVPAFREMVEMVVMKRRMYARIQRDGFMVQTSSSLKANSRVKEYKPHPLMSSYRSMMQMVQVAMHRFRLAPVGKEVVPGVVPTEDDWDEFDEPPTAS